MPPLEPDRQKLTQLRKLLIQHFSLDELRVLCFDLGLEYDDLPGDTKTTKMHGLIEYLQRRDELNRLLEEAVDHRPHVAWPTFKSERSEVKSMGDQKSSRSVTHKKTGLEMIYSRWRVFLWGPKKYSFFTGLLDIKSTCDKFTLFSFC